MAGWPPKPGKGLQTDVLSQIKNRKTLICLGFSGFSVSLIKIIEIRNVPERIRTSDLQFRKLSLYPAELRERAKTIIT